MRGLRFTVAALLAILLVASFAACSDGGDDTAEEEQPAEEPAQEEPASDGGGEEDQAADTGAESQEATVEAAFESLEHEGYTLQWRVDGDMIDVVVSYETTGWLSVGFDPSRMMKDANIVIGYVDGDTVTISDEYGTGQTAHRADTEIDGSDDLENTSGSESGGVTELRFSMPLDSGDSADKPLEPGQSYTVLLAHGPDGADDKTTYHEGRTSVEIEI
jgi:hypothetical protein